MTRLLFAAVAAVCFVLPAAAQDKAAKKAAKKGGPMIGHMVYFKLKDASPEARKKLVEACDKYLSIHDGTVFYSAGTIAEEFKREVNDRDWDVALHLVFTNKAAHDKYATHPEHLKFIEENKANWEKVRVFDSELAAVKSGKKPAATKKTDAGKQIDDDLIRAREKAEQARRNFEELEKKLEKQLEEFKKKSEPKKDK